MLIYLYTLSWADFIQTKQHGLVRACKDNLETSRRWSRKHEVILGHFHINMAMWLAYFFRVLRMDAPWGAVSLSAMAAIAVFDFLSNVKIPRCLTAHQGIFVSFYSGKLYLDYLWMVILVHCIFSDIWVIQFILYEKYTYMNMCKPVYLLGATSLVVVVIGLFVDKSVPEHHISWCMNTRKDFFGRIVRTQVPRKYYRLTANKPWSSRN